MRLNPSPVAIAAVLLACLGTACAQAPARLPPPPPPSTLPPPPPRLAEAGPQTVATGRIARWLVNPNGEADGLLLADGTQVAFPPHLSAQLTAALKTQDAVEITGRREETGRVLRASNIRSIGGGQSIAIELEPREPGAVPPPPRAAGGLAAMSISSRIDTLLYTGRGDLNGVLLHDGTVVRFPPQAGTGLAQTLQTGAVLYARGYGTRSPWGTGLEATAMGPSAESARELFAGPAGIAPRPDPVR